MKISNSEKYHRESKFKYQPKTETNTEFKESWNTVYFKVYEGFELIKLPQPKNVSTSLSEIITNRKSIRGDKSGRLNLETLSSILHLSLGEIDRDAKDVGGRRAVSSAGARYPIEAYILLKKPIETLKTGLYHYRVDEHALEYMFDLADGECGNFYKYEWANQSDYSIFLTAVFERTQSKYKERGYRFALLEAGAIGQAIQNTCVALGINSTIMGGTNDDLIEGFIDIDGVTESLVNALIIS